MKTLGLPGFFAAAFLTLSGLVIGPAVAGTHQDQVRVVVNVGNISIGTDPYTGAPLFDRIDVQILYFVPSCGSEPLVVQVSWPSSPAQIAMEIKEFLVERLQGGGCLPVDSPRQIVVFMPMSW